MKIKRVIKKVAALGTGATMVGATLLGALAADLSQYPDPLFIKNGVFDGIIVVGDEAASSDVVGSVDIATALQFASTSTSTSGGGGVVTTVEGDAFKIMKSGDNLNFGEQLNSPTSVVDEGDLDALADGEISNEKGSFNYDQFIDLPDSADIVYEVDSDQTEDPELYLKFADDYKVYTYRLSFPTALRTDVDTSDDWQDLDNKQITLLGKEYTITGSDNSTGTLTLMGGAVQDTLNEGETKTYTINGVDYEVEVTIIASTEVLFKVNGEVTEKMLESETYKLKDGTELGVKTLLSQDFAGGSRLVEFFLGASKVELKDNNFGSNADGSVEVDSDSVSGVYADIVASTTTDETRISKIEVQWNATDDFWVPVGGKLSDRLASDEKGKLFLQNIDYEFAGVEFGTQEEIKIRPAASDKHKLSMPTKAGDLSINSFYTDGSNLCNLGKDDDHQIITAVDTPVGSNDRFIVSSNKFSHVVEVESFDTSNAKVKFKDIASGDTFEVSTTSNTGTIYLDGFAYDFKVDYPNKHINITDDMGSDGAVLFTPNEAKVELIDNGTRCYLNMTEDEDGQEDSSGTKDSVTVWVQYDSGATKINVMQPTSSDTTTWALQDWDSKDSFSSAYTKYGTYVEYNEDPTQDTVDILYPSQEAVASVYISSGVTRTVAASGTSSSVSTITPIQVGTAKLASEVRDITAQNMIVVGGPCANAVARELMGATMATCLEGFTEGKAMIKLYEQGTKVAMLVAGMSALDTRRASRVLANYDQYALSGAEVEVSGTTLTDISVSTVG
jgi:hypothetical protein